MFLEEQINLNKKGSDIQDMGNQFERTELLIGADSVEKLKKSHVAIFGVGGVGGYVAEALSRSGVGKFDLIDNDTVSITNLNRQIIATHDTIGQYKTKVMKDRILSINPDAEVNTFETFYMPENSNNFDLSKYDYIIDAIDTITAKLELIQKAKALNVPIISSMGAGNKLDATKFQVADIYKTSVCPLAKVMRRELKKRGITSLKVVYSQEEPRKPLKDISNSDRRKAIPSSIAYVPSVVGLIIGGEVIKDITGVK